MNIRHICLVTFLANGWAHSLSAEERPLSVCEALNKSADHQRVVIRAKIAISHQIYLFEGTGQDPCPGWRKRFFTAPSAIPLLFGSFSGVPVSDEVRRTSTDFVLRLRKTDRATDHIVTATGVLLRKPWPLSFRAADGTWGGWGSGIDGGSGSILVLTSVPIEDH
jgi:hypothetical protein